VKSGRHSRAGRVRGRDCECAKNIFTNSLKENTMSSMSEQHQSRKFADKSAAMANEAVQQGRATAERSAQVFQQSLSTAFENMREYNLKMIDMTQANTEAVFEIARQLATVKTPSDIIDLCTSHAQRQFEALSEQTKELTALGQKLAQDSAEPIAHSFNQAFSKAS
jgi:phasin